MVHVVNQPWLNHTPIKYRGPIKKMSHLRSSSHEDPRPTHVSKSQRGGQVPTFEPSRKHESRVNYHENLIFDDFFNAKMLEGLKLRVGSRFLLDPTLNTSPKPHLQEVLPCRHPSHTWASRPRVSPQVAWALGLGRKTWGPTLYLRWKTVANSPYARLGKTQLAKSTNIVDWGGTNGRYVNCLDASSLCNPGWGNAYREETDRCGLG
jgi:hypothetical protein